MWPNPTLNRTCGSASKHSGAPTLRARRPAVARSKPHLPSASSPMGTSDRRPAKTALPRSSEPLTQSRPRPLRQQFAGRSPSIQGMSHQLHGAWQVPASSAAPPAFRLTEHAASSTAQLRPGKRSGASRQQVHLQSPSPGSLCGVALPPSSASSSWVCLASFAPLPTSCTLPPRRPTIPAKTLMRCRALPNPSPLKYP